MGVLCGIPTALEVALNIWRNPWRAADSPRNDACGGAKPATKSNLRIALEVGGIWHQVAGYPRRKVGSIPGSLHPLMNPISSSATLSLTPYIPPLMSTDIQKTYKTISEPTDDEKKAALPTMPTTALRVPRLSGWVLEPSWLIRKWDRSPTKPIHGCTPT